MLEIKYLEAQQDVCIALTQRQELWAAVRAAFQENAEEISSTESYRLCLPVWAFLSCRQALGYIARKHELEIALDEPVRRILQTSAGRENGYKHALEGEALSEKDLQTKLDQEGFARALTENQKRNVLRLASLSAGATFSVPGAGKTTEALAFYYYRRTMECRLLVVCPKNAFAAWEEQLALCVTNPPQVVRLTGGEKAISRILESDAEVLLITYQQLPNVKRLIARFMVVHPTMMFLDESHHIKRGVSGQWSSTVLGLSHLPVAKLIMTGTPLPNSITDLIPQLNFIYPELDIDDDNAEKLIKPVFVRTTKRELGLPEVRRMLMPLQLKPNQRNLYELLRSEEARQLAGLSIKDKNQLRRIGKSALRLLQAVSNPALLLRNDEINLPDELYSALSEGDSPKIEYACYKARKLAQKGQKVIIWSGFVENVELIASRLVDIGADFIHGGVEAGSEEEENTRERKISRFHNDDNAFVLVANPAACAEGISLHTVCHHAIYVDRNYNAAQYLQSEDRIHRLGLKPDTITTIEILHSPDTVDESVLRRLASKVNKMAAVLDDNSLEVEPVVIDLEVDGVDAEDAEDYIKHISRM
jgi:SNF2 family DNA or RNA helicase